jgi:uroporphyrinogen-III synthase
VARALVRGLDEDERQAIQAGRVRLISISPVTSEVVRELGLPVAAEAAEYTMAGVVAALANLVQGERATLAPCLEKETGG